MEILINTVIIVMSLLLILVVLIQNPKGGGLSSEVGSAAQLGGVAKTTDTIEKSTWFLAAGIMVMCLASSTYFEKPPVLEQQDAQTEVEAE